MTTPRERVISVYPESYSIDVGSKWIIVDHKQQHTLQDNVIGGGITEESAWSDAASKLK